MQVQSERIPQYLKDHGRFCNWKYELRNGNQTKVPYIPGATRRANVSDPATFTTFETAASATGYDGIGIRVCGRIVGIDLDHCIVDGKLLPWVREIIDRFHATYIEVSPSGTGIRIFCLLPDGFTYDTKSYYIKKGDIEVYISGHTNRFLTITGNALTGADVVETAEALIWLLDTYMRRPTPPTLAVAVPGESYLSDDAVIAKASVAHNGEKFCQLWECDITGYKSHSEADAALLSILAFWCSGDTVQMDRLFRRSALMREKWDEYRGADTYGNISIQKAVTRMTDFYKPIVPRSAAEDFGAERLRELDPMNSSKYPWNDIGIGVFSCILLPKQEKSQEMTSVLADIGVGIRYAHSCMVVRKTLVIYGLFVFLTVPAGYLSGLLVSRVFGDTYWYLTAVELVGFGGMMLGGLLMSIWGGFKSRRLLRP